MFTWWDLIDLAGSPRNPLGELRLVVQVLSIDRAVAAPVHDTVPARELVRAA